MRILWFFISFLAVLTDAISTKNNTSGANAAAVSEEWLYKLQKWIYQLISMPETNKYIHKESSCLQNHDPGSLTTSHLKQLSLELPKGPYRDALGTWANRTTLFPLITKDGIALQGYSLLQEECSSKPLVFFGVGYTESTVKYAHAINSLFEKGGFDIYSFDYRGQGFSSHAVWDDDREMRVSHLESFNENAQDLADFIHHIQQEDKKRCHKSSMDRPKPVYIGNSMGGLLGYYTQRFYEDLHVSPREHNEGQLFSKLFLLAPCIEPYGLGPPLSYVLHLLHHSTPRWWSKQIFFVLAAFDVHNNHLSHDMTFLKHWDDLRNLSSRWLIVYGPSLNFLRELVMAGYRALTEGENKVIQDTDIFVVMAEEDKLIDHGAVQSWYEMLTASQEGRESPRLGKRRYLQIPRTYHELWGEGEDVTNQIIKEAIDFL